MFGLRQIPRKEPEVVAAVDLGSNSFHMIVAKVENGQLKIIDKIREMVRLRAGLKADNTLTRESQKRALECLERFGQRLRSLPQGSVRVAGTKTLREARAKGFLKAAEKALGHPIEVIAGREEARLVYLGIAHGLEGGDKKRLVVDIGGGSTELIVGQGFSPIHRESTNMGCVSMTQAFFADGVLREKRMKAAVMAAEIELTPFRLAFNSNQWDTAVGSSGTIRAIRNVVQESGWCDGGISREALDNLRGELVGAGHLKHFKMPGVTEERLPVFPGGVAVLLGVFESLNIDRMDVSDEAMREGLLYDLVGRIQHEDIRSKTVETLTARYEVAQDHAERVESTAMHFLESVAQAWALDDEEHANMLRWAARLHEIGLTVSHSQYQKHGAYLLQNSDMSGFSRQEQAILSALVRGHRRKFPLKVFRDLPSSCVSDAMRLCVLLRLSVLLHRSREDVATPEIEIKAKRKKLKIRFPKDWLNDHPLTRAELQREKAYLKAAGLKLKTR